MIDKKEPSFVFVMEQHSRKQSVCNKIRVHCFPHWSSVSTTIPHLEVKDCLFSLSIRIINLFPCYLCLLHLRIFEYPILSEDAGSQECLLSEGETRSCRLSCRVAMGNRRWSCLSAADPDSTHLSITYPVVFHPTPSICVFFLCDCPNLPWIVSSDILRGPRVLLLCVVSCPFIPALRVLCVSAAPNDI